MTALALGLHEKLVRSGVDPRSDDYYERVDKTMKKRFPDYFGESQETEEPTAPRKTSTVVAPATRSTAPRQVRLTVSEAAIAKREQRAKKEAELLAKHGDMTPTLLKAQLQAAYKTLADQPTSAVAKAQTKELEKVLKIKTKDSEAEQREELKGLRDQLRNLAKDCTDSDKLQQAIDILAD